MKKAVCFIVVILTYTFLYQSAFAKNIALLIGNADYSDQVGSLKNPTHDVRLVGDALKQAGFDIETKENATRHDILRLVRKFVKRLNDEGQNTVGFFYYSGHGVSRPEDGRNFLIPTDILAMNSVDAWDDAVSLEEITRLLEQAPNAAKILVFDACRSELRVPTKGAAKGFVQPPQLRGMMIAFATGENEVAYDLASKEDEAGPYAAALAAQLQRQVRQTHSELFQNVKMRVLSITHRRQHPYELNGLEDFVYFPTEAPDKPDSGVHNEQKCDAFTSTIEKTSNAHTGPTITVNVVLIDAKKGCVITGVEHTIVKEYNLKGIKTMLQNGNKLARIEFKLFDKPSPGFAKIDFKLLQKESR